MKLTKVETVYQLTFLPKLFPINCYLVEEKESLTLIDTGMGFACQKIIKTASFIGKPITKIVLTHPHNDHIGGLHTLKEILPTVAVYISRRDAALMVGDFSLQKDEPSTPIKGGFAKDLTLLPDKVIDENDYIGSLRAICAPGHTPGSMAFYDTRSKVLIAGDAFHTRPTLTVTGDLRLTFPFPAFATWNKKIAIESAKKLNKIDCSALAIGHGPVLHQPKLCIEKAIKHAENTLRKEKNA